MVCGPATISGSTATLTGAGTVTLQASEAAAGNYTAGTQTATFMVLQAAQTITFAQIGTQMQGGTVTLTALRNRYTARITIIGSRGLRKRACTVTK